MYPKCGSKTVAAGYELLSICLRLEALSITEDRGHGEGLVAAHEAHGHVVFFRIAVELSTATPPIAP